MFSADQFTSSDKKYLHYRVLLTQIQTVIHGNCNNILIFFPVARNFLSLPNLLNTADKIPVFHSIFKPHFFGCRHHFLCKHVNGILKVSI